MTRRLSMSPQPDNKYIELTHRPVSSGAHGRQSRTKILQRETERESEKEEAKRKEKRRGEHHMTAFKI